MRLTPHAVSEVLAAWARNTANHLSYATDEPLPQLLFRCMPEMDVLQLTENQIFRDLMAPYEGREDSPL